MAKGDDPEGEIRFVSPDRIEHRWFHFVGPKELGSTLIQNGHRVLSHCGLGLNRSALVAGLILVNLGMNGKEAVTLLRQKRPGALFNRIFASYLQSL